MIKAVILDDESKAIEALSWELKNFNADIEVIATFTSPKDALPFLKNQKIDCLFLDIEMPNMHGFEFLEKVDAIDFCVVITTAYSEYAITALKKEAIDYLLKPIDIDDLRDTFLRIKKFHRKKIENNQLLKNTEKVDQNLTQKIKLNANGKLFFIAPNRILYAKSDGNYTTLYFTNGEKLVIIKKLKEIDDLLPNDHFFRVHNSYIINLKKIKEFQKVENTIILENEVHIPISRQRKTAFLQKI